MFQVVQEYERAVIFRLGRLVSGGAKGPGKIEIHCQWSQYDTKKGSGRLNSSEKTLKDNFRIFIPTNSLV